ncbi:monovalent cation/H+ antiporter complex subunit F [Fusibacter tunisiensis]|uniref:Multicomponent Na+:H+ antiporter subunit F n=1 Tax=Fusibacter tunisiensis TaxID=1008308 RepID=A0ABS2MS58_9FIRM|nr:monovalent cation/H+ antiporter complex subunit F [Fusibacter tunisiensis]MBM7562218.1 multicomponent Na+:H+ antiporter subunit F [Fusibacter tunisiensis]
MAIAIFLLMIFSLLSALRVIIGPTIWDKLLGLNLVTAKLIVIIVLVASMQSKTYLLDLALVYALLSFIGIVFMSYYLQRKGRF